LGLLKTLLEIGKLDVASCMGVGKGGQEGALTIPPPSGRPK